MATGRKSKVPHTRSLGRRLLRGLGVHLLVIAVTLVTAELILQRLNPAYLWTTDWQSLGYQYDPELGWRPAPNSTQVISLPRQISVAHNSLGLRDIELEDDGR